MHEDILIKIGEKFKQLRKDKGYTSHEDFAIDHDITRFQYWKLENGKTNMTLKTLIKILDIHEVSIEDFFSDIHKYLPSGQE